MKVVKCQVLNSDQRSGHTCVQDYEKISETAETLPEKDKLSILSDYSENYDISHAEREFTNFTKEPLEKSLKYLLSIIHP